MRYTMEVIGEPDENGLYPLYITLHGGGGGEAWVNNEQWFERKDTAFYWLKADHSVDTGLIEADYNEESNTVYLQILDDPNGEIKILASPFMMDFDKPLTIVMGDREKTVNLKADKKIIEDSLNETGDMQLAWADEISISVFDD